jgi:hypothetical protein
MVRICYILKPVYNRIPMRLRVLTQISSHMYITQLLRKLHVQALYFVDGRS